MHGGGFRVAGWHRMQAARQIRHNPKPEHQIGAGYGKYRYVPLGPRSGMMPSLLRFDTYFDTYFRSYTGCFFYFPNAFLE